MTELSAGKTPGIIDGLDACSVQVAYGQPDYAKVKAAGFRYVQWKASQYSNTYDHTFDLQIPKAQSAGLVVGAFHFCSQASDPIKQMDFFYNACQGLGSKPGEMPPMLDWEFCSILPKKTCVDWIVTAAAYATRLWYPEGGPRKVSIYTFPYFGDRHQPELGLATELHTYPLNLASYKGRWNVATKQTDLIPWYPPEEGVFRPLSPIPKPWSKATFTQYSGNNGRRVPGMVSTTDRQLAYMSEGEWMEYLGYPQMQKAVGLPDGSTPVTGITEFPIKEDVYARK